MSDVTFKEIRVGTSYSRQTLAQLWGYESFHAIARGVVTPKDDHKIILFVTEEKQDSAEQYQDSLREEVLDWEGPLDHFAEDRMIRASITNEEIHLFYRVRHHADFVYLGRLRLAESQRFTDRPSKFRFQIIHNQSLPAN
jgi:hypothetical protein